MADSDEAKKELRRLSGLIVQATAACKTAPSLKMLEWHLEMARKWFGYATAQSRKEDYDAAVDKVNPGQFHASLAIEMAKEYAAMVALLSHTGSEPAVFTDGAANTDDCSFCKSEESDRQEAFAEWRKMGLLIARCRAVLDVHVVAKERDFTLADTYIGFAAEMVKPADEADDDDMRVYFDDGLFFVRSSLAATVRYLQCFDVTIELPKAKWDTEDETPDDTDSDDTREAITALVEALVDSIRSSQRAQPVEVLVATFHLSTAESYCVSSKDKYDAEEYTDATVEAKTGLFHARLAAEVLSVYNKERGAVAEGDKSTANDDPDSPDGDWCDVDEDDDHTEALSSWRKLSLATAKVQALFDTKGSKLVTAADHMDSLMFYTESVQAADWDAVSDACADGMFFVETAVEAADAYINGASS